MQAVRRIAPFVVLAGCALSAAPAAAQSTDCAVARFTDLRLDNAKVTDAAAVAAGSYTPPGTPNAHPNLPAFCLVAGVATPTADSLIKFEVWVPQGTAWNGKLVVTGNGGYSPALSYGDMAYAMRQGDAAIGGDTGHQVADVNDM
jgi:feruloyl esterase